MNRDTLFVEFLVKGGFTYREAACVERWIEERRPAGKGTMHFLVAIERNFSHQCDTSNEKICLLLEQIDKLEAQLGLFSSHLVSRN